MDSLYLSVKTSHEGSEKRLNVLSIAQLFKNDKIDFDREGTNGPEDLAKYCEERC